MASATSSSPLTLSSSDFQNLINAMLGAAAPNLVNGGANATSYATHEFTQFVQDVDNVNKMVAAGDITADDGQFNIDQYKLSMQSVLITVQGLSLIAIQNAINAALNVLNTAIQATLSAGLKIV
jgi:hypothetical protein